MTQHSLLGRELLCIGWFGFCSTEETPIDSLAKTYKTHLTKGLSSKKAAAPCLNIQQAFRQFGC